MTIYQKALVALDLSDQKPTLLDKVTQVISTTSEVHVCAVIEPFDMVYPISPMDGYPFSTAEFQEKVEQQAIESLNTLAEVLNIPSENAHLLVGKPSSEIKQFAQQEEFDIIVVGTHGKGAARAMLGSTSNGVLHDAPCDVLAIRYS